MDARNARDARDARVARVARDARVAPENYLTQPNTCQRSKIANSTS